MYYLENGVLPTNGTTISKNSKDCVKDGNINPNDDDTYYGYLLKQMNIKIISPFKTTDKCVYIFHDEIEPMSQNSKMYGIEYALKICRQYIDL